MKTNIMQILISILILLTSVISKENIRSQTYDLQYFNSNEYQQKSAADKMSELWSKISSDQSPGSFPNALQQSGIFFESMDKTFKTHGDEMPVGLFNQPRVKFIHSVGCVGKVKYIPYSQDYTGIFKGANQGIIRLSSAAKPSTSWIAPQPLTPGMGLKFLRNGIESANLVSMQSVNGQKSWNFFSNSFYNHIGSATSTKLKLLADKFATATKQIQEVGLSDMSGIDEEGKVESPNKFPFSLRFEPHSDVHTLFSDDLGNNDPMIYMNHLQNVPEDSFLQNVYAYDIPKATGGTEKLIGALQLDGWLIESKFGDVSLFFRHQFEDEDLKIHPEWAKYCPHH